MAGTTVGAFKAWITKRAGGGFPTGANSDDVRGGARAKDTMEKHRSADGSWSPERKELHNKIVSGVLGTATRVETPTLYLMGGGTASGKSTAINSGHVNLPANRVLVDPDELKAELPEYQAMVAAKDVSAASFVHEESSYLSKQILKEAAKSSMNVLLDGTGDSGIESVEKKLAPYRAAGIPIVANYVTVDTETALARNLERAKQTGRLVDPMFVAESHAAVSRIVPELIARGAFDQFNLIDTNGSVPIKVASAVGTELTIHDEKAWRRFLDKGMEHGFDHVFGSYY